MLAAALPPFFNIPFANGAGASYIRPIPQASQIGVTPGAASLADGFPPLCFLPVSAGGVPPFGQDMNGILNEITANLQWLQAGGVPAYNAAFSAAIGGYPKGAVLASADGVGFWLCAVDGNGSDPDTGGANWTAFGGGGTGCCRDLAGTSAGLAATATWTVAELTAARAVGGLSVKGAALSLSFNGATLGANGMDSGAMPVSGSLYIYAIYNPVTRVWATLGTVAGNGAPVYSGGAMPTGYSYSALIWAGVTNNAGQFTGFVQQGRMVAFPRTQILSGGTATVLTAVGIGSVVPYNAKSVSGDFSSGSSTAMTASIASTSGGIGTMYFNQGISGGSEGWPFPDLVIYVPQTIYYGITGSGTLNMALSRYTF